MLNSVSQMAVRGVVQALPEEQVNMTWRSSLNEQLLLMAAQQRRKRRMWWYMSPVAGFSVAVGLAFFVLFQPSKISPSVIPDRGIESAIFSDHHNSVISNEVANAGLNDNEVANVANTQDPQDGVWSESDVESL